MDNITHSLMGIVLAEAALSRRHRLPDARAAVRPAYWIVSLVANNFPDLDFIPSAFLSGDLGYLLHHRGHTHTLLLGPPQALLSLLLLLGIPSVRRVLRDPMDRWVVAVLALLGPWAHVGLDALNSYGVHPFWPIDNRWYYGDTLFILEPWLWLALGPAAVLAPLPFSIRVAFGLPVVGILVLAWTSGYLPHWLATVLTLFGTGFFALSRRMTDSLRPLWGIAAAVAVIGLFAGVGSRARIMARAEGVVAGARLDDLVMSPMPANPFCWVALFIESPPGAGSYALRRAMLAPFPFWLTAAGCPKMRLGPGTAPLGRISLPDSPTIAWLGEYTGDKEALRTLHRERCGVAPIFQFARAPFVAEIGPSLVVGDLRYDFSTGSDFAERTIAARPSRPEACLTGLPPWIPPRQDWLR